jgi:hypothetical protein
VVLGLPELGVLESGPTALGPSSVGPLVLALLEPCPGPSVPVLLAELLSGA